MKVILPKKADKDAIELLACDLSKGILISDNPRGLIIQDEDGCSFHRNSCYDLPDLFSGELIDLWCSMSNKYPSITLEWFPTNENR